MSGNQGNNQDAGHGGSRKGAGRKPGSKTKARKVEVIALADKAKVHADEALRTLVDICRNGSTDSARVAAANSLLDRGYGRPRQELEHTGPDGGALQVVIRDMTKDD